MSQTRAEEFLDIVPGRRGHFQLESGHHSALWLDLDALFAEPRRIGPFVTNLAGRLAPYQVSVVCGPLLGGAFLAQLVARELGTEFCFTEREMAEDRGALYRTRYHLPSGLETRLRGNRVAIVDDVMSAGSALRGTYAEVQAHGANPVVAGALLVLGETGLNFFAERGVPVEAVAHDDYELWLPTECALCAAGVPIEIPDAAS